MTIIFTTENDQNDIAFPAHDVPVGPTPEHPQDIYFNGEWISDNGEW